MLFGKDSFLRKNQGKFLLGYEIGSSYVQISYMKVGDEEPTTLSLLAGMEEYNIPFFLFRAEETGVWYFGKEALEKQKEVKGQGISNLMELACSRKEYDLGEETYETVALLALFVKRSFSLLSMEVPLERIAACTFTMNLQDEVKVKVLKEMVKYLQLKQIEFHFMGKEESFFYYNLHTEKELWKNQVMLYEMDQDSLTGYRLHLNRNTSPVVTLIDKKNYSAFKEKMMNTVEEKEKRDKLFLNYLQEDMEEAIVSTVYLIGNGFLGEWYQRSVRYLCQKRRVFLGNNLFSKGACYGLSDQYLPKEEFKGYVYLGSDKVIANVGLQALQRGKEVYFPILDGGSSWYECEKSWDFILEQENKLDFRITPLDGKNIVYSEIILHGLDLKYQKYCRIHMEVSMESRNKMMVKIWEKGFGEYYPSRGQYWEERIEL